MAEWFAKIFAFCGSSGPSCVRWLLALSGKELAFLAFLVFCVMFIFMRIVYWLIKDWEGYDVK